MSQEEFQKQVLDSLNELKADVVSLEGKVDGLDSKVNGLDSKVNELDSKVNGLDSRMEKSDYKFDTYRQATQSLVNLAFGLIASATVITVVSAIFKR